MNRIFALLLLAGICHAQPMISRLDENLVSTSPRFLTSPFLDTGNLPANSGWIGEWELILRLQCDVVYDSIPYNLPVTPENAGFPVTFGGLAVSFSFPENATLKSNYEFWLSRAGYWWSRVVYEVIPPLLVDTTWSSTDVGYNQNGVYLAASFPWLQGIPVSNDSAYTTSPTSRISMKILELVNDGKLPPIVESGPGDGPTYIRAMDTAAVVRIRFRIDVGETPGHVYLRWSTLAKTDFTSDDFWLSRETWEEEISGEPNFSTTIRRGSTLTLYKLY